MRQSAVQGKLAAIRKRNLKEAEDRHELRCRALIAAIRKLPKPICFAGILEQHLQDPSGDWFGDAAHFIEAMAMLESSLSTCVELKWLQVVSRRLPMSFSPDDKFELAPGAYRVNANIPNKRVVSPGVTKLRVYEREFGLEVAYGGAQTILSGSSEILFETLWAAQQSGQVVAQVSYKKANLSLPMAIRRLRQQLATELGLDGDPVEKGIAAVPGQKGCYRLSAKLLKIIRKGPSRQRGVVGRSL